MGERRVLRTAAGDLDVHVATEPRIEHMASRWPLPIATMLPREDVSHSHNERARFILPFAYEGRHVNIIYIPQVPRALAEAKRRAQLTRSLSSSIVLGLLRAGFGGLAIPLTTLRDEGAVGVPGLGLVVGPPPDGEHEDAPRPLPIAIEALNAAIDGGLPFDASSKPKYVPPSATGALSLDFGLIDGDTVICFRDVVDPNDPCIESFVRAGVRRILHMPLEGTEFPELGERIEQPAAAPAPIQTPAGEPEDSSFELLEVSANGARRIYRILAHIAACDGRVDPTERDILDDFALRFDIPAAEARRLEEEGREGKGFAVGKSLIERELLFEMMVDVAAADGVLHPMEEKRLVLFADQVGIPREQLRHRIQSRFGTQVVELGSAVKPEKRPASAGGLRRIYRLLWFIAGSDGDVGPDEDALLDTFRKRSGIGAAEAASLRNQGLRGRDLEVGKSPSERALLLDELVAIAAADGVITSAEARRLRKFTKLLKVPPQELERRLKSQLAMNAPAEAQRATAEAQRAVAEPQSAPAEPLSASAESRAALADTGWVLLLDVPKHVIAADLKQVAVEGGFRGFKYVPAGVHRFGIPLEDGEAAHWVNVQRGEVEVLVFDGQTLRPGPEGERRTQMQRLARAGSMDGVLQSFGTHFPWLDLTAPLRTISFPPRCFPVPDPAPESRLALIYHQHGGSSPRVIAELAYTFLRGVLGDDPQAMRRWTHMVQAFYQCGEQAPKQDPTAFAWVVHLLIAQQQQLPQEMFARDSPITFGSHYFSEDLIDTEIPELIEAGREWAVFIAGSHQGAPETTALPESITNPHQMPTIFAEGLAEKAEEIAEIEFEHGRFAEQLLPHLSYTTSIQEMGGDLLSALATQERMVDIGGRCGTPPADLSKGYGRLARLYRAAGRAADAAAAEQKGQALAIEAAQRN